MTPERHQQIKRLFLAAVELAPGEVEPFLAQACGTDETLRGEVQGLLDHHRTETLLKEGSAQHTAATGVVTTTLLAALRDEAEQSVAEPASAAPARPAGTIVAGRYRLVAPLGGGGMGVVYRADDIELGQTIALKFLRPKLEQRPDAVEFLRREVRTARQITHPNVVRIYDIGTSDTELFISMEYVAGEDLESLVRRVGPLPCAKITQIARQLAAGLAAAHAAGILHRDLKPANVMIDGQGNVRILDFGIAAALDDEAALRRISGTPGFLAPELLTGEKPSQRSDLYAWGLVVYFAATGKLPRNAEAAGDGGVGEGLAGVEISADVATCVRSCLQADPTQRPHSAREVQTALLGGDPLGEALRAGAMPSLEVLSAAACWKATCWMIDGLLAAGLVLLAIVFLLADRTMFLTRCGLVKSPQALEEIAEQLLTGLGHAAPVSPVLTGVSLDTDCLQFMRTHAAAGGSAASAWQGIAAGEIPAVVFSYRQADPKLPRPSLFIEGQRPTARAVERGSALVRLSGKGNLLSLQVATSAPEEAPATRPLPWRSLFQLAGLQWADFRETAPSRWPPEFADGVQAWEGPLAIDPNITVRVTGASIGGRVVFFEVEQPWEASGAEGEIARVGRQYSRFVALRTALWLVAIGVACVLAFRHVRLGHADWRGAWRVTACTLLLATLNWLCGSRHTLDVAEELATAVAWICTIVTSGAIAGVAYLAVEPAGRRWWPYSLITARRALDGQLLDRGVWADGLLGMVVGVSAILLRQACTLVNQWLGVTVSGLNDFDPSQNLLDHFGLRYKIAVFVTSLLMALLESLLLLTLVVALKRLTKSTIVAGVLLVMLLAAVAIVGRGIVSPVDWLARTLLLSLAAWVIIRFGLTAAFAALATYYSVNNSPLTLDFTNWYAGTGLAVVATVAVGLVVCWRLGRRGGRG
jgi:hypothetical protein